MTADRARSFGAAAAAYAEHRPGYPPAAVSWALAPVAGRRLRILDLAAGTGALTAPLARLPGADVLAVDPDPAMLAELRRALPAVPAVIGAAEALGLAGAAVDAVLVGQALHWFHPQRAFAEIARVLRPGGVLAGLWNLDDDRVDWVAGLREITGDVSSFPGRPAAPLISHPAFGPVNEAEFGHAQRRTAESLVATIGTHSGLLALREPERAALLARIRGYLDGRPETASGEFELPLRTLVVRARRLG